ncbi:hypothetical protein SBOR_8389 [Sclerotinia borealis F-4128]|uniref:Uncharacterized protein n=1 Tax=Sclerotinia borealis (strain F-4128) TaxID=1432307 RepID=W9C9G8_SCLBF|nr:hypothetical protein SBOR_8389 [Sclerotinia borealis F-4128]
MAKLQGALAPVQHIKFGGSTGYLAKPAGCGVAAFKRDLQYLSKEVKEVMVQGSCEAPSKIYERGHDYVKTQKLGLDP